MPLELKEHLKRVKDRPEKEKDWSNKRSKELWLIWRLQDKDNLLRNKEVWLNKPELSEKIT